MIEQSVYPMPFQHLLAQWGYDDFTQTMLPRDASRRQYIRLEGSGKILMIAPPSEKPEAFLKMSALLNEFGLSAPRVFEMAAEHDLYVIDDFGESTYGHVLSPNNQRDLYILSVEVLCHIVREIKEKPDFIPVYDHTTAHREAMLLCEWYGNLSAMQTDDYDGILGEILIPFTAPNTLMLRDYHVDNLFFLKNRQGIQKCGLIDFQDGMWGPVGYDLVSLTHDVRRDVSQNLRMELWQRYLALFPKGDHEMLEDAFDTLNLARHLRILGVFSRLSKRDQKHHYLKHFPRIQRHLREILHKNTRFQHLKKWCIQSVIV